MRLNSKSKISTRVIQPIKKLLPSFEAVLPDAVLYPVSNYQLNLTYGVSQDVNSGKYADGGYLTNSSTFNKAPTATLQASPQSPQAKLHVMMLGLRGFPNVQGGVEVHAEHLCPLLVSLGCDVEVLVRSPYQHKEVGQSWQGVKFNRIWAPKSKGLEAIIHTFLGVLYAAVKRPDILHIHAIGPAVMTPLARLLGLRVVVTHHGPDYNRQKWGWLARNILQLGETLGMRFSNGRIAISNVIRELVMRKHVVHAELIHNGVILPENASEERGDEVLEKFGLKKGRYVLLVSRLVPEKRHLDLMQAFAQAKIPDCKLAIVGASDHPDAYVKQLLSVAENSPDIVMTGYQTGHALHVLYANAGLYVLPSSHEGLSISLLEALSYGLPVLASDIPANLELGLPEQQYFALGDLDELQQKIASNMTQPLNEKAKQNLREWVSCRYDWRDIARQTLKEYRSVLH